MNFQGILVGLGMFLIIGLFHSLAVKGEHYIGLKIWIMFLIVGILFGAASLFISNTYVSILFGILSFACFWSILKVFEQRKGIRKG